MSGDLRRTPLYDEHVAAKAKLVPFAGYEMPVQYPSGITAEHNAVRNAAGLFDVSHMGEFEIVGPQALELVQFVSTNDAAKLKVGQAQYSTLPKTDGTLLDDLLVYRLPDRYMLVVNASNREKDFAWISGFADRFDAQLTDRSDDIALLALQGPHAESILARLTPLPLGDIDYYHFTSGLVDGHEAIVSRTGYTGEDGFELYVEPDVAANLWRRILAEGEAEGVIPAGLGARDSLRLEMGYALYGNDLDESHTPYESGLAWVTSLDKGEMVASEALRERRAAGPSVRLVALQLLERGFPRHGFDIAVGGEVVGTVTSGTMSPTLGFGIALGYLPTEMSRTGTRVEVLIRGQPVPAEVVRPPFYKQGSIRR